MALLCVRAARAQPEEQSKTLSRSGKSMRDLSRLITGRSAGGSVSSPGGPELDSDEEGLQDRGGDRDGESSGDEADECHKIVSMCKEMPDEVRGACV